MNIVTEYDILFGKEHSHTPFRYHTQQRKFICCHEGSVSIKMSAWENSDLLNVVHDYESYDFRSPIRVWNPQAQWVANVKQMETMDIVLEKGCMLYIPSFWWYSIRFEKDSLVSSSQYSSFMNCVYNIPSWALHYIQETSMEDRLTNLKDHFSTSKSTKREAPTDVIIPTENIHNVQENVKVDTEVNEEPTQEISDEIKENNTENEIKETLESITSTIEENQHV